MHPRAEAGQGGQEGLCRDLRLVLWKLPGLWRRVAGRLAGVLRARSAEASPCTKERSVSPPGGSERGGALGKRPGKGDAGLGQHVPQWTSWNSGDNGEP